VGVLYLSHTHLLVGDTKIPQLQDTGQPNYEGGIMAV
jgi:hypothetical protein